MKEAMKMMQDISNQMLGSFFNCFCKQVDFIFWQLVTIQKLAAETVSPSLSLVFAQNRKMQIIDGGAKKLMQLELFVVAGLI